MIRCKFTCTEVLKRKWGGGHPFVFDTKFQAVTNRDAPATREAAEENEMFWAATPAGQITVSTVAADHFEVGRDYYVDFTPAP